VNDTTTANQTIDWLLQHFEVSTVDKATLIHARKLRLKDFEDAVVTSVAVRDKRDLIISRNTADFSTSPIKAISPTDFLKIIHARKKV
jgi:hypothetical protein